MMAVAIAAALSSLIKLRSCLRSRARHAHHVHKHCDLELGNHTAFECVGRGDEAGIVDGISLCVACYILPTIT